MLRACSPHQNAADAPKLPTTPNPVGKVVFQYSALEARHAWMVPIRGSNGHLRQQPSRGLCLILLGFENTKRLFAPAYLFTK